MYGGTQRFTLLLLEEGEDYVADFNAYIFAPGILSDIAKGPVTIDETSYKSPGTSKGIHGKLRLCTKSVFFDAEDISVPILRLPFTHVMSCNAMGPKELHMKAKFYTTCKAGNLDRPYVHKQLNTEASVVIQLEFASMDSLIVQLMQVLEISKTSNFIEKGMMLKEFSRQQAANCTFDYRRLTDEFRERILMECRARQVTPLIKQPGVLVITDRGLYFQPLHNLAGGALVKFHPAAAITSLARRRIALRPTALEVFMQPHESSLYLANDQRWVAPSVMFLFEDHAAREEAHHLLSKIENLGADVKGSSALQRGSLLEGKGTWLLHVQNAWIHGKVTNLEYLLYLNFAAGRTFNDLAQWPVFPWVLKDYTSEKLDLDNEESFRDLSKPMGALGHPMRLAEARERWQETNALHDPGDPDSDPGFMYGSHYSTPGYVMYWLVRKTPEQMLRLQNGRFDAPDRLFFGIGESWNSSSGRSNTDVKELIPEFFLPGNGDFLVNTKNLPLGKRQNGTQVSNVILPPWCKDAPDFIWKHRQALESRYVQQHLHLWIDLIFGCKQRGAAAVAADNVFRHTSYAGDVDLDAITDPVMRMAKEAMISEFGQTPAQLFDENQPHPPRKVLQPVPKDPLPGYCSFTSQSPEISHTLVHTLLEVSASDSMHSVLSSPQPMPQRAGSLTSATSAPSPLATPDQDLVRSGSDSRGPASSSSAVSANPVDYGAEPHREVSSAPLPSFPVAPHMRDGSTSAQQAVQRGRSSLNRLSAGLSRLGAGILSGLQHSQGNAQHRSSVPGGSASAGAAAPPAATIPHVAKVHSTTHAAASSCSTPQGPSAMSVASLPPGGGSGPQKSLGAQQLAPDAAANASAVWPAGGQAHDRSNEGGMQLNSEGVGAASGAANDDVLAGCTSTENVSSDVWPCRLHESIKVRHRIELPGKETVSAIACMDDSVASGTSIGILRMHGAASGVEQQQMKLPRASLVSSLHVPCSASLASSCVLAACFSKVHAFAPEYGVLAGEFEPHADLITCMSSAPMPGGSGLLYTASEDTTVKTWPVDAERNPWMAIAPPLFEIDSPDASIPKAVKAHRYTGAAVVGSDAGHCAVFDSRSGQLEWLWQGEVPSIADVALVPSPAVCNIVVASEDGQLLLLDMRRSGSAAVLAKVADDAPLSCVETDGNSAVAGSANGGLLVWNLDPAAEQTAKDTEVGIPCTGAGLAFKVPLSTRTTGAVQSLSINRNDGQWLIAVGHEGGVISINELGVSE